VITAGDAGYAGMTVSAVIAKAGVSRKTFYEFFKDREDLFIAAFDGLLKEALDGAREAFARGTTWPEQLRSLLEAGLDALARRPDAARLGFVEVLAAGPLALARREQAMRAFAEFLSPGFEAARETANADVPALMPEAVGGALYEIVYTRVLQGRTAELPEMLGELLFCALAPFLGPSAAAEHAAAAGHGAR
jgi:AcrR family transcriptional regulator